MDYLIPKSTTKLLLIPIILSTVSWSLSQTLDWVKVAPLGAGFSVMMPGKPDEEIKPRDDFTSHLFTFKTEKAIYLVGYGDYSPAVRLDGSAELIANRDNFLKGVNAKLVDSKEITMDGRKGIEFTADRDDASFKSRIYLFGNRIDQISVAVFKDKDDSANVEKFFSSFTFVNP